MQHTQHTQKKKARNEVGDMIEMGIMDTMKKDARYFSFRKKKTPVFLSNSGPVAFGSDLLPRIPQGKE